MFTVELDVSDFTGDMEAIRKGMVDGSLMTVIGNVIEKTYLPEVFETEGAITGQKWAATIRGEGILQDTGTMKNSFFATVKGPEVVIGNTQKYFPTHERGATIRAKNVPYLKFKLRGVGSTPTSKGGFWRSKKEVTIPERSMLRVGQEMLDTISDQCADWIDENWGKR